MPIANHLRIINYQPAPADVFPMAPFQIMWPNTHRDHLVIYSTDVNLQATFGETSADAVNGFSAMRNNFLNVPYLGPLWVYIRAGGTFIIIEYIRSPH